MDKPKAFRVLIPLVGTKGVDFDRIEADCVTEGLNGAVSFYDTATGKLVKLYAPGHWISVTPEY